MVQVLRGLVGANTPVGAAFQIHLALGLIVNRRRSNPAEQCFVLHHNEQCSPPKIPTPTVHVRNQGNQSIPAPTADHRPTAVSNWKTGKYPTWCRFFLVSGMFSRFTYRLVSLVIDPSPEPLALETGNGHRG